MEIMADGWGSFCQSSAQFKSEKTAEWKGCLYIS